MLNAAVLFFLEIALVAVAVVLSLVAPARLGERVGKLVHSVGRFARRRTLAVLLVGLAAFFVSMGISLMRPPTPAVHDEFCYLLCADTFAHGRLANPTHPMWRHFESFHIIHEPSYVAKYPPGQGLVLALGQVLTGRPIVGIWLSAGLAAAAICWMLQGWVPPRWALLGGAMVVVHIGIQRHWGHSYWGGNVALIGAALVFGALPRILRRADARAAMALGVGLVVLAASRPFEGLVVSFPVAVVMLGWLAGKRRPPLRTAVFSVVIPISAVLAIGGAAMSYYNYRTTGNAMKMPYQLHEETYAVAPNFLWQSLRPEPTYRHAPLEHYHGVFETAHFDAQKSLSTLLGVKRRELFALWYFLLRVTWTVPLLALPWMFRSRRLRFVAVTVAAAAVASMLTKWFQPHYFAPAVPLVVLLVIEGIRGIRLCTFGGRPSGRFLARAIVGIYFFISCLAIFTYATSRTKPAWYQQRARLVAELESTPEEHLVIVRYGAKHDILSEWVYNGADIDASKVVFAREMAPAANRQLLDYFTDRRAWLLEADVRPLQLTPYPKE